MFDTEIKFDTDSGYSYKWHGGTLISVYNFETVEFDCYIPIFILI